VRAAVLSLLFILEMIHGRQHGLRNRRRIKRNYASLAIKTSCAAFLLGISGFFLQWWALPSKRNDTVKREIGNNQTRNESVIGSSAAQHHEQQDKRIAILIPFLSSDAEIFPPYASIFLQTVHGSSSLVDFLILHNGELTQLIDYEDSTIADIPFPPNVKFIDLGSMKQFVSYFLRVIDMRTEEEIGLQKKEQLHAYLVKLFRKYPYFLVEYKVGNMILVRCGMWTLLFGISHDAPPDE
jgi:hypothetical protein